MSRNSSFDDFNDEVFDSRYSLSASDYDTSRGTDQFISNLNYMDKLKLASEVMELKEKVTPLGHMPTTQEMIDSDVNEITPLLRQLGISGQGNDMCSRKTRKVVVLDEDIRFEGNVPIIMNSELFAGINEDNSHINSYDDTLAQGEDVYDPNRPLHEQFKTIAEFALPCESLNSSTSESISSLSSWSGDESSYSSNNTSSMTENASEEDELSQPLLEKKQKVYTPRQLYEIKKRQLDRISGHSHRSLAETEP